MEELKQVLLRAIAIIGDIRRFIDQKAIKIAPVKYQSYTAIMNEVQPIFESLQMSSSPPRLADFDKLEYIREKLGEVITLLSSPEIHRAIEYELSSTYSHDAAIALSNAQSIIGLGAKISAHAVASLQPQIDPAEPIEFLSLHSKASRTLFIRTRSRAILTEALTNLLASTQVKLDNSLPPTQRLVPAMITHNISTDDVGDVPRIDMTVSSNDPPRRYMLTRMLSGFDFGDTAIVTEEISREIDTCATIAVPSRATAGDNKYSALRTIDGGSTWDGLAEIRDVEPRMQYCELFARSIAPKISAATPMDADEIAAPNILTVDKLRSMRLEKMNADDAAEQVYNALYQTVANKVNSQNQMDIRLELRLAARRIIAMFIAATGAATTASSTAPDPFSQIHLELSNVILALYRK